MGWIGNRIGCWLAHYLNQPSRRYRPSSIGNPDNLRRTLQPGDVLLVEGIYRISVAIKYLTQSTWSHAALYVGELPGLCNESGEPLPLIEADLNKGVQAVSLSTYTHFHTRICRPVNLTDEDRQSLIRFVLDRLGHTYDLQNVFDLARYLFPMPPVPVRWRRRLLALGSGDPTKAICSTLIAEAFQHIGYPILPIISIEKFCALDTREYTEREIMHIRHHSLYAPRDFDLSPYFKVVKPTIENGFNYKGVRWHHKENQSYKPQSRATGDAQPS